MEQGKLILVVEDDAALRRVLNERLGDEGFAVLDAADGEEGLRLALEKRPALIMLDIFMPKMDGVTMLSRLRSSADWGKDVRVMVLTNSSDASTMAKVSGFGATDFLVKSEWSLEALVARVRERLAA